MPCDIITDCKSICHCFFIICIGSGKVRNRIAFCVIFEQAGEDNGRQFLMIVEKTTFAKPALSFLHIVFIITPLYY